MGNPAIFNGPRTKLLTSKGLLLQSGATVDNDGPKNYITYPNFENNATTGWTPTTVTITSGVPTGAPSTSAASLNALSVVSSGQLAGSYSLNVSSSAAWSQGQGLASQAYTIDLEDKAKVLSFKFYYSVISGAANATWSGTTTNTFQVWIYDIANSAWIQPTGVYSMQQTSGVGYASGTFQTPSNATSFQICVLAVPAATSGAVSMYFDDFYVGPQSYVYGSPVTDWTSFTPTGSWTSNVTYTGRWRRVGDFLEADYQLQITGAVTAGNLTLNIPNGWSIDTTKLVSGTNTQFQFGLAGAFRSGIASVGNMNVAYNSTTSMLVTFTGTVTAPTAASAVSNTAPYTWANNDYIWAQIRVPIQGWSSNVQMSSDAALNVVSANIGATTTSVPTATHTKVNLGTVINDTNGSLNAANNRLIIPVSGYYTFQGQIYYVSPTNTGYRHICEIYKNGVNLSQGINYPINSSGSSTEAHCATSSYYMNAGDYIELYLYQESGSTVSVTSGSLSMERVSGPSAIAATETVAARYISSASNSIGTSWAVLAFATKDFDYTNSYNSSTGLYTCPAPGIYEIGAIIMTQNVTIATSGGLELSVYKNGVLTSSLSRYNGTGASATVPGNGINKIKCNAGDTLGVYAISSVATSLVADNKYNQITFTRVGN